MASRVRVLLMGLFILMVPIGSFAQGRLTAADIQGTTHDQTGGGLPGVAVTARKAATNQSRTTVTDKAGHYYIGALQPGVYTISAGLIGFAPQNRKDVRLFIGQFVEMNFTLRTGVTEAVTVTARAPVVDPTETSVSTVVGQEHIDSLPTNGRNFLSFSVLTPGVTTDRIPQQSASATSGLTMPATGTAACRRGRTPAPLRRARHTATTRAIPPPPAPTQQTPTTPAPWRPRGESSATAGRPRISWERVGARTSPLITSGTG